MPLIWPVGAPNVGSFEGQIINRWGCRRFHLNQPIWRQHVAPVGHQSLVQLEEEYKVGPPRGEVDVRIEIRCEDGKSGVDRMPPAMDEGRIGEDAMDEAQPVIRIAFGPNARSVAG